MTERIHDTLMMDKGSEITVTVEGRTYEMTVAYAYSDNSIARANARTVVAWIRPGGYSVTLRNDNLDRYDVRKR